MEGKEKGSENRLICWRGSSKWASAEKLTGMALYNRCNRALTIFEVGWVGGVVDVLESTNHKQKPEQHTSHIIKSRSTNLK